MFCMLFPESTDYTQSVKLTYLQINPCCYIDSITLHTLREGA